MEENKKPLREQGETVFALDIGTRTVIGIVGEYIDDKFILSDYVSVPHSGRTMVDGQVEDIRRTAKTALSVKEQLEQKSGIKLERVAIAAAGRALRTCRLEMDFDISAKDALSEDDVKSMEVETIQKAQEQLDNEKSGNVVFYCVGHSVVRYKLDDYKMISLVGHKGDKATVELIAAFLPSAVVEGLYAVMDLCGLEVDGLTLEPIAAMNVIVPREIRLINIALVDIGAGTSDIAIAKDGTVYAYAMATTAGDEITEEIIRTYLVDFNTAEALKQGCSAGETELEYRDILGMTHKIKGSELSEKLKPAVETLADTICSTILEVNDGAPAAVFLVGGGSLTDGLPTLVAEKLGLDEARVAIGGGDFLKNVDDNGERLGAEYVTPLGIAVTSTMNSSYDFSVITVNDKKIRAFDTKQLSVFEALRLAGCKSTEIVGRSGLTLNCTINKKRVSKKGGGFTPAEVRVNGKPASVTTKVTKGDKIDFIPAVSGENASAKLSDFISFGQRGEVTFGGEKHKIGVRAYIGGEEKMPDYDIQPLDDIETTGVATLGDLLAQLDIELDGVSYLVNGEYADENTLLSDGDVITVEGDGLAIESEQSAPEIEAEQEIPETKNEQEPPELTFVEEKHEETPIRDIRESGGVITVELNGEKVTVARSAAGNMLLDLLNLIEIDPTTPNTELVLQLNGVPAQFSTLIHDGDRAVIKLIPRV